jgi:hypothetical protein
LTLYKFFKGPGAHYNANPQGVANTSSIISAPPMMTGKNLINVVCFTVGFFKVVYSYVEKLGIKLYLFIGGLKLDGGNALLSNLQNPLLMGLKPTILPFGNSMFPNQNMDLNMGGNLPMNLLPGLTPLGGPLSNMGMAANNHGGNLSGSGMMSEGGGMMQSGPMLIPQLPVPKEKSDSLKKVFVKNIPEDVPDEFLESLFKVRNLINLLLFNIEE